MPPKLKILIIEDFPEDANLIKFHLTQGGIDFDSLVVETKEDFEAALENFIPDAILCDHTLPQFDSVQALKLLRKEKAHIPFILVTGSVSEEFAVQMIHSGAHDYIIKDRMTRLPAALMNAMQKCRVENEKIKYLEELIANEELFKKAGKIAHFGIYESDFISGVTKWTDELYNLFGYEKNKVTPSRENFINCIHPDDRERILNLIQNNIHDKTVINTFKAEYRVQSDKGELRYISAEIFIERDEESNPLRAIGFHKDISEKKKNQQILLESLKETSDYKYALDESSIVAITDQKGIIKHANDNFCKISKYSRAELIGADHRIINSGYHPKEFIKELWNSIAKGKVWRGEFRNKAKDGSLYWVDTTIIPFLNEKGKPYQYISIRKDITSRKLAEVNLMQSEHRFRQFFESAPEAVLIMDIVKKIFVDFNDNALKLLKTTREELLYKSPLEVTAPMQPEGIPAPEKMVNNIERIVTGENLTSEWLIHDSEGNDIFCEIRASMLSKFDKNLMRLSVIDITERKNAEKERNAITEDLFNRNKDLEQFTYIVSHNLRAPVANILGFSEELNSGDLTEDESIAFRKELHEAVKRLDSVIMDLNDILNVGTTVREKRETVFFSNTVHFIKRDIKNLIENNEVAIFTNFTEAPEIETIKSYMHSIFFNLISNSIKYKQSGKKPVIEISSCIKDGKLILTFKDNGMGIDLAARKNQIFGLYKRFHQNIDGKGLGLFMIKSQIAALGGHISIESEINKGTTFTIVFNT